MTLQIVFDACADLTEVSEWSLTLLAIDIAVVTRKTRDFYNNQNHQIIDNALLSWFNFCPPVVAGFSLGE